MQVLNELKFIFKLVDGLRSSLEHWGMSGECARNKGQSGVGQPPDLWKRECGKARSPIKGRLRPCRSESAGSGHAGNLSANHQFASGLSKPVIDEALIQLICQPLGFKV
jgi:hypothetical protein